MPVLGMISDAERAYFARAAQDKPPGAVVDLGCWFGASTSSLSKGIKARNGTDVVEAYDRFIWEDWMIQHVTGTPYGRRFKLRDDFLPAFLEQTAPWRQWVRPHKADLKKERWTGGPIGLLVVDAMKSWPLVNGIACGFYGALLPGSVVIQQDFAHWYTPWIVLSMYMNRDAFEPVCHVPASGSVVFRVRSSPCTYPTSFEHVPDVDGAFKWAMTLVDRVGKQRLQAARAMVDAHQGRWDAALKHLDGLPDVEDFGSVRAFIERESHATR